MDIPDFSANDAEGVGTFLRKKIDHDPTGTKEGGGVQHRVGFTFEFLVVDEDDAVVVDRYFVGAAARFGHALNPPTPAKGRRAAPKGVKMEGEPPDKAVQLTLTSGAEVVLDNAPATFDKVWFSVNATGGEDGGPVGSYKARFKLTDVDSKTVVALHDATLQPVGMRLAAVQQSAVPKAAKQTDPPAQQTLAPAKEADKPKRTRKRAKKGEGPIAKREQHALNSRSDKTMPREAGSAAPA
jgi:hypothetical protein